MFSIDSSVALVRYMKMKEEHLAVTYWNGSIERKLIYFPIPRRQVLFCNFCGKSASLNYAFMMSFGRCSYCSEVCFDKSKESAPLKRKNDEELRLLRNGMLFKIIH